MKIAIAQTVPIKGDITSNVHHHIRLIETAIESNANAIFFPELSLTGYEPSLAAELSSDQDDQRLNVLQALSDENKITIAAGLPTKACNGVRISMIIFQPFRSRQTYSKQILHADEWPFFVHGEHQVILNIGDKKVAPAICYESRQASHSEHASALGAEMYITSVAETQAGVERMKTQYPVIAQKFSIPVLMSNCVGPSDNFTGAGQSAIWTERGQLLAQLNDHSEGIIVFNTATGAAMVVQ